MTLVCFIPRIRLRFSYKYIYAADSFILIILDNIVFSISTDIFFENIKVSFAVWFANPDFSNITFKTTANICMSKRLDILSKGYILTLM